MPFVQRNITVFVEKEASKIFNTSVRINKVRVYWLNRVALKGVMIADRNGNVALEADNVTIGFQLLPALNKQWRLTTIRLFGLVCHIRKETPQSEINLQFLIDALSKKEPNQTETKHIEWQIQSILVRRGSVLYDVATEKNIKDRFDPNHIMAQNINGNFSIEHIGGDSLDIQIKRLSFGEISGLSVDRLSAHFTGNKDSICVDNLELAMPVGTHLRIPSAGIQLIGADSLPQLLYKAPLYLNLEKSQLALADFAAIIPALRDFPDVIELSARLSGYVNSLSFDDMTLTYGNDLFFVGDMDIKGLADKVEEPYLFGRVQRANMTVESVTKIGNHFSKKAIIIPKPVMNIQELAFNGEISGFMDHLVAFGNLSSSFGSMQIDLLISHQHTQTLFKGSVASSDIRIGSLFEQGNPFGKARFNAEIDLQQPHASVNRDANMLSGNIRAQINTLEYKGYNYENINIAGRFKDNKYEGSVQVNDPNGQIELQGMYHRDGAGKSVFDLAASVVDLRPDKLHLIDKYENPNISFKIKAGLTGNNVDNLEGYIAVQDLSIRASQDSFALKRLRLDTQVDEQPYRRITLSSDIVNGELKGLYSFSSLGADIACVAGQYLPTLANRLPQAGSGQPTKDNVFDYFLTIENTDNLSNTLHLPIAFLQKTRVYGYYNSRKQTFYSEAEMPRFRVGNTMFENGRLRLDNAEGAINLSANVSQYDINKVHNLIIFESHAKEDGLQTKLHWENDHENRFETDITATALFVEESDNKALSNIRTEITIPSAQIVLKDSIWHVEPASVTIVNGDVHIDNFYVKRGEQYIHINGDVSDNPTERLLVELKDIEMSYIFDVLNIPSIHFSGRATGAVNARDLSGSMMIDGRIEVQDFAFNHAVQGKLNLSSEWDNEHQGILLLGSIYKNDSTWTDVNGYIYPVGEHQGLSLYFDANELNIAFLETYMEAFASEVRGQGFGKVHLFGDFSDVFIEGAVYVKDAHLKINILNVAYSFSDSILLHKQSVESRNTTLYDQKENKAWLDLSVMHDCFRNIRYDINVKADHLLVYDATERMSPQIYGQIYASGNTQISGTEDFIRVDGSLRSEAGTNIGFNFMNNSTVENYDFITFVDTLRRADRDPGPLLAADRSDEQQADASDYQLNFSLDITPDANIELVMDPVAGDKIKGHGSGDIQLQYGSRNDLQMFGNYIIADGTYNFSLQQVIRKRFNIHNGSVISFRGDPMDANLDINAAYSLTANIQDLDEMFLFETGSPNVLVNCILKLNGRLQNPAIAFDLELPNSNIELERHVKSFIDTEDMMNRQIIYLLALNSFYTPDYSRNEYKANDLSTIASSALSSQLSNILNNLTDKVQIGANIHSRQDGVKDTEVEMLLSSQLLNNRLLFNGNFGYKDNPIQSNAFVGEFDLEYKLLRSGEISLKAYNHANDLYRYNSRSLSRQGVGLMFRKDFSTLSELFSNKKRRRKINEKDDVR